MNVKIELKHIKSICLTAILFVVLSTGNGLLSQSLDMNNDSGSRFTQIDGLTLKVYPNPATDYVTVSIDKKFKGNFKLNNIFGKVLLEGDLNGERKNIDLLKFRTGIYIISIFDDMGQKVGTRKIIKN